MRPPLYGNWRKGDIGAATGSAPISRLIQFGQKIHGERHYRWNHIFIVVSDQGDTVEALGGGVARSHVRNHPERLNLGCPDGVDREKVAWFARSCVGIEYGFFDDILLGIDCLTGARLCWRGDSLICSELGALALNSGGWKSPLPPALVMPADLVGWLKP